MIPDENDNLPFEIGSILAPEECESFIANFPRANEITFVNFVRDGLEESFNLSGEELALLQRSQSKIKVHVNRDLWERKRMALQIDVFACLDDLRREKHIEMLESVQKGGFQLVSKLSSSSDRRIDNRNFMDSTRFCPKIGECRFTPIVRNDQFFNPSFILSLVDEKAVQLLKMGLCMNRDSM